MKPPKRMMRTLTLRRMAIDGVHYLHVVLLRCYLCWRRNIGYWDCNKNGFDGNEVAASFVSSEKKNIEPSCIVL